MSTKPVVVASRRLPESVETRLRLEFDARLNAADRPFAESDFMAALREADAIIPTVGDRLPRSTLLVEPLRTRIIANYGVGTDHIDLETARARNILVTNTPDVLTECTADLTIALMLAVMRRMSEAEHELRAGQWSGWHPTHMLGTRVSGKTLGIIGFGRIGRAVARRAGFGFGMTVLFFTPRAPKPQEIRGLPAIARASIEEVLRDSDVVSIHAPGSAANRHLINAARIRMMKPTAYLLNTSRGELIDTNALVAALQNGSLAGAGLDVFENEPNVAPPLLDLPNAVLLPHIGSATLETRTAMGMRAIDNLVAFFQGREPADRVA
jgi:lactate dehydrogenase-like 2-hydroxyacid dehydrogenase